MYHTKQPNLGKYTIHEASMSILDGGLITLIRQAPHQTVQTPPFQTLGWIHKWWQIRSGRAQGSGREMIWTAGKYPNMGPVKISFKHKLWGWLVWILPRNLWNTLGIEKKLRVYSIYASAENDIAVWTANKWRFWKMMVSFSNRWCSGFMFVFHSFRECRGKIGM